jgi:methionyl-tRNA formyltransferase
MRRAEESFTPTQETPSHGAVVGLVENALLVSCSEGCYAFARLRPAGRGSMDATAFYNGYLAGTASAFFTGSA